MKNVTKHKEAEKNRIKKTDSGVDIDINIDKALPELPASDNNKTKTGASKKSFDSQRILIAIAVVAVIFVLILSIGKFSFLDNIKGPQTLSLDQLHQLNKEGKLDEERGYMYNGYSFVLNDDLWWMEREVFGTLIKVPLHFGPKQVEEVPIRGQLNPAFNEGGKVYLAIDPEVRSKYYSLAISELSFNLAKGIGREPVGSCTAENWACENRTIVTCQNTGGRPVIELVLQNETGIELSGTCIKISGQEYGIVKAANRVLYKWYGVME
ncbi:hypothetical protein HYU22_04110 [Candidatus Woesearchaeota archaeon]|nr:hypothetical protein [Candidatus Woesearchaeota archaeon]